MARFRVSLGTTVLDATFARDSNANTRLELSAPSSHTPQLAMLWSAKDGVEKLVDYHARTVSIRKWPAPAEPDNWSFGGFAAEWSDHHDKLAGHDCRRVKLKSLEGGVELAREAGECWISESLMLVLRERIAGPGGTMQEWEIVEVEQKAPPDDVLAIPPGFREMK